MALALFSVSVRAQETDDNLTKQLANPLAAMISVPTQINYDDDLGVNGDGSILQINVQPVIPFQLNDTWNLITRTIVPIVEQEDLTPSSGTDSGMGDILGSAFFSPIQPTDGGWIWGAGPALLLPTATDDALGADQWALGPTFVALKQQGHGPAVFLSTTCGRSGERMTSRRKTSRTCIDWPLGVESLSRQPIVSMLPTWNPGSHSPLPTGRRTR